MTIETEPLSPEHEEYIRNGGCPYYSLSKTWCNERVKTHYPGMHYGLYLYPPPSTKVRKVFFETMRKAVIPDE